MTEPATNEHAAPTGTVPGTKARTANPEPLISNLDYEGALICMKTQRQIKAVQLLHGGASVELETLENYAEISEIQALMRAGPIYHLGPERKGFSWARPNSRHNDNYLISLSLYRRGHAAESWVYSTTEEMAKHAQELGIDHAYIWSLDPDDRNAPGFWNYVRTNTPRHVLIPYETRTRNALDTLQNILEFGPVNGENDFLGYSLPFSLETPFEGTKSLIDIGVEYNDAVCLLVHHSGRVEVAVPLVSNPGTDPANYAPIPVTDEEQATLAARVVDTYTPD